MYNEGTTKALWATFLAVLLAIALTFKTQTLFMLRFTWDLIRLNAVEGFHSLMAYLSQQLHFWPFSR